MFVKQAMGSFDVTRYEGCVDARPRCCTAGYLVAHQDGGKDVAGNIAAACWLFNTRRHTRKSVPAPDVHRAFVKSVWRRGSAARGPRHAFLQKQHSDRSVPGRNPSATMGERARLTNSRADHAISPGEPHPGS